MTFLRKLNFILFLMFVLNVSLIFLMFISVLKGDDMIQFSIDFVIFLAALLFAVGGIFLFGSILFSFFGKNQDDNKDVLPLDMIYKSKKEVDKYRKDTNIPNPNI